MLTFVLGTRPEAIKALPLLREAKKRKVATRVILTGQHTDLMVGTGIKADRFLHVPSGNEPEAYVDRVMGAFEFVESKRNDTWAVIGDTASALAGARWASSVGIPVAHVEAGLRSHDLNDPWPEEGFRVEIDGLATYHFCPTVGNLTNLVGENELTAPLTGHVTGNTIVDQLRHLKVSRGTPGGFVLVTLHRRESFGEPLRQILIGLRAFALGHPHVGVFWPLHPNPHVREALQVVPMPPNVALRGPLPYAGFLEMLASASCVLTDSGGVVEEATTLGVPIVCARNKTERPEAFELPWNRLCGTDNLSVEGSLRLTYHQTGEPSSVFGDGDAASRILDVLC